MGAPVLIGAGVGALGSTLMGGSPLKGALLGGSLGSGYGGIKSLMEGGSFMQGAMPFASSSVGGAGIKLAPTVDTALNLSPVATSGAGAVTGGAGINLTPLTYKSTAGLFEIPTSVGGAGAGISDLANFSTGTGTQLMQPLSYYDRIKNMLPEMSSQNVGNVIGGANVAQQYMQRRPIPQAPAGGVSRGSPPPAEAVQQLVAQIQAQQPRRRLSLLVG